MRKAFGIVFAALYIACGFATFFVLPTFHAIYNDLLGGDQHLPCITRLVLNLTPFGWLAISILTASILLLLNKRHKSPWPNISFSILLCVGLVLVAVFLLVPLTGTIGKLN